LDPTLVETDNRGRVVLPGKQNKRFLMRENEDGSILLQPATVVTMAQYEFHSTPELQDLLARATATTTVHRVRQHRT
jgi:hypothetical protein